MKKEIREVKEGVVRITVADERWYVRTEKDAEGIPHVVFVPSVTWIASFYPKGVGFYKWLANTGWNEAEAQKEAAGIKGTKVHRALEDLVAGKEVRMENKYPNPQSEKEEELGIAEYECLLSFVEWARETKPTFLRSESVVWSTEYGYAGTVDLVARIGEETYIIDFKTSQNIWPEHRIQLAAYRQALREEKRVPEEVKLAILQLGYRRGATGYKFTEIADQFDLFLAARTIWQNEVSDKQPPAKEYPPSLKL